MPLTSYNGLYLVNGPPGTGKTSWLAKQVKKISEDAALIRREAPVLLCSLTRTAAQEIAGRDLPISRSRIGTLHAHAYHALENPEIAEAHIGDWNKGGDAYKLSVSVGRDLDEDQGESSGECPADELYNAYNLLRARTAPRETWPLEVINFAGRWEAWKQAEGYLDFSDLISVALEEVSRPPEAPEVIIADEAQDLSALEFALLKKWGEAAGALMLSGDPYQCQPPGTMVATPEGEIPIEDLDPSCHRVISFDRRGSAITGYRNPLKIKKACRAYIGELYKIQIGKLSTRCTDNHRWTVKFKRHSGDWHAVYLMRKGHNWRVGRCAAFRIPNNDAGSFGPITRCRQEKGDAVWVLGLYKSAGLAEAWQQIVSVRWQIPTTCFKDHGVGFRNADIINIIYDEVGHLSKPKECLRHFGRSFTHPFWVNVQARTNERGQDFGRRIPLTVTACNLLPEIMQIPIPRMPSSKFRIDTLGRKYSNVIGKEFDWANFSISREAYAGPVYSLDVERHHHYIADGIITQNSLYNWRGAHPEIFFDPAVDEEHKRFLRQSYRVPIAAHRAALNWLSGHSNYVPIEYKPKDSPGEFAILPMGNWKAPETIINAAMRDLAAGKTVMIMGACGYMLAPLVALLRRQAIPFCNPWRRRRGDWNPLNPGRGGTSTVGRLMSYLRPDVELYGPQRGPWTFKDLDMWLDMIQAKGVLLHGQKKAVEETAQADPARLIEYSDIVNIFDSEAAGQLHELLCMADIAAAEPDLESVTLPMLDWLEAAMLPSRRQRAEFPLQIIRRRGPKSLAEPPMLFVGTINSFKGAEADCVYVMPDISPSGMREWMSLNTRDSVIRLFYVAFTRAKEKLVLCQPANPRASIPITGLMQHVMN
jgi:hypothetical protein